MTSTLLLDAVVGQGPRPADGPKISALFLLIPAALLVVVGIWGWRNAGSLASAMPLDERTQEKRRRVYRRGAVTCVVVAGAFVFLTIVSFFPLGSPP